jgi:hypothetical protein
MPCNLPRDILGLSLNGHTSCSHKLQIGLNRVVPSGLIGTGAWRLILGRDDMDCCGLDHCHGHALTRRQWMWSTVLSSVGTMLAGGVGPRGSTAAAQTAETASAALDVLRKSISVDVHTHGGTSGITSQASPNDALANGMRAGSLAVACLADVPDAPILGRDTAGVLGVLRAAEPGELYKYHLERLDWLDEMVTHHGLRRARFQQPISRPHTQRGYPRSWVTWKGSTSSRESSSGSSRRISAASGTFS